MPTYGRSLTTPIDIPFLVPTENWGDRQRAKQQDLVYQKALADESEKELVRVNQQRAQIQAEYDNIKNLPFLEEDRLRIGSLVNGFEKQIQDKIRKKYNGNVRDYLNQEADLDKQQYKRFLTTSDAYNNGMTNKQAMANYIKDRDSGRLTMMANGKTFSDQYSEFRSGATDRLVYNGSYKPSDDFYKGIEGRYGADKFKREQAAPEAVLAEIVKTGGLTRQQAIDQYQQQRLDQFPIYYKADDPYDKAMFDAKLANERRQAAGKTGDGSGGIKNTDKLDAYDLIFGGLKTPATIKVNGVPMQGRTSIPGTMNADSRKELMTAVGGVSDDGVNFKISSNIPLLTEDGTRLPTGAEIFQPKGVSRVDINAGKKDSSGRPLTPEIEDYIYGSIIINEPTAERMSVELPGWRNIFTGSRGELNGSKVDRLDGGPWYKLGLGADNVYEVKNVRIPAKDVIDASGRVLLNKGMNVNYGYFNSVAMDNLNAQ